MSWLAASLHLYGYYHGPDDETRVQGLYGDSLSPSALTEEALKRIAKLYAVEAEIRGMPAEQRLAERQHQAKPLLKSLES